MILFDKLFRTFIDGGQLGVLVCGAGHLYHANLHNAAISDMRSQKGKSHDVGAGVDAENRLVVEHFGGHGFYFFNVSSRVW